MELPPAPRTPYRLLVGLLLLLLVLGALGGWFLAVATSDPYGLTSSHPIASSNLGDVDALYGLSMGLLRVMAWSPDGRHVAVAGSQIVMIDTYTGATTAQWTAPGLVASLAWSPDGKTLAAGVNTAGLFYDGWVILYNLAGVPQASWSAVHQNLGGLAWSPDGGRIFAAGDVEYGLWTSMGAPLYHVMNGSTLGTSASWSPDGTRIALSAVGGPTIIDATTGAVVSTEPNGPWTDVAWSPRGDLVATTDANGHVALFGPDGTEVRSRAGFANAGFGTPPSWSPDGTLLAAATPDGVVLMSVANLTTERVLVFPVSDYRPGLPVSVPLDLLVSWSPTASTIGVVGSSNVPSFRLWGVRVEPLGLPLATLGLATAAGLGLLFHRDVLWCVMSPDRVGRLWVRTDPRARVGAALFAFATVYSLIDAVVGNALGRVYGLQPMPSATWFVLTGLVSLPTTFVAAAVAAIVLGAWLRSSQAPVPFAHRALRVFGFVLLPFLLATGVANAAAGLAFLLAPSLLRTVAPAATGLVFGLVLGFGFYYSGRIARGFPWARSRFPWIGLAASALASMVTLFGLAVLGVLGLNLLHVQPPSPEFATYGFTLVLGFGFVPFVAVLLGLLTSSAATVLPSALRFAGAGYARVRGSEILELETRRKVLELIVTQPGLHFRGLLKATGLGSGTLHYHLSVLEREGFLHHERQGRVKRFYARLPHGMQSVSEVIDSI